MTFNRQATRSDINLTTLLPLLKTVSRSFYLSIRILPYKARGAICIAYLLARAADSIADSDVQDKDLQIALLSGIKHWLDNSDQQIIVLQEEQLLHLQLNDHEHTLLTLLPDVFSAYNEIPEEEKLLVQQVVHTLIDGMLLDINTFAEKDSIKALNTFSELDHYTYLVAGCVGEFWTKVLDLHYNKSLGWNTKKQIDNGIRFGKALQLTNILRDIEKDAAIGRCYLPEEDLRSMDIDPDSLLKPGEGEERLQQDIIPKYIDITLEHYQHAEKYLLNTPRLAVRLRLASLWPIAIGLKTLSLLKKDKSSNPPQKIKRSEVYLLLSISPFLVLSNTLTQHYLNKLRGKLSGI